MSILLLILGPVAILRTPTDIFPNIDIPVVSVIWNYTGLSPEEMSNRIIFNYERSLTTTAVSYTHLDVYKRQAIYCGGCGAYRSADGGERAEPCGG